MSAAPDDPAVADLSATLADQKSVAAGATADLQASVADFNPPQNATPQFHESIPQDHFNEIVGISPLIMALGAIGGKFGNAHGIAMLQSTNAMMKGMVTGSAEQYSDARQQYEQKYDQWKDQNKTWNDTYKAYMTAYKGRIDAQQRAVQGANAAVGITEKELGRTTKSVQDSAKISAQIEDMHSKIKARDSKEVTDEIKAKSAQARAETAQKEVDLKIEDLKNKTKTADTNTLAALSRSIKSEADNILKQYPAGTKRPPDIEIKLTGLREQMDMVHTQMQEHTKKDYNDNKAVYDQARAKIAAGGDAAAVKKRLASLGLDPDQL